MDIATNIAAQVDKKELVHDFIYNHVMYHIPEADVWNLPFVNVPALDIFRYDPAMMALGSLILIALCLLPTNPCGRFPGGGGSFSNSSCSSSGIRLPWRFSAKAEGGK